MIRFLSLIFLLLAGIKVSASEGSVLEPDLKSNKPPKGEWISLFDGKSLNGWHLFNRKGVEIRSWKVEDGSLVCLGAKGPSGSGDIISDRSFENFELKWEWKVDKGSNSGVFYHIVEAPKYKRAIETSPEYQIIDDINFPAKLEESQKAGADYGMYSPEANKVLKPVGEWNTSRIIFNKGRVEYWLNGLRIIKFKAWTKEWNKLRTEGKWKDYPDYGLSPEGRIGLQDHGNKAYFKNIEIREL
jgi:hypothetical protein